MIILEGKFAQVCSPVEGFVEGYCSFGQSFERFVVFDFFNRDKGLKSEKELNNEKVFDREKVSNKRMA
jgi:hypothetical protein